MLVFRQRGVGEEVVVYREKWRGLAARLQCGMPLPLAGEAADRLVRVVGRSEIVTSDGVKSPPSSSFGTISRQREKEEDGDAAIASTFPAGGSRKSDDVAARCPSPADGDRCILRR